MVTSEDFFRQWMEHIQDLERLFLQVNNKEEEKELLTAIASLRQFVLRTTERKRYAERLLTSGVQ